MNKREFFKKRDDNKSPNNERGKRENSSYSKKQTFKKFTGPKPSFRSNESNKPSGNNNRFSKKRDDNKSPNNERGKREASSYNKNPNNLRDFKKPYKFKNNNNRGSNFKARPFRKNISSKLRLDLECKICKSKIRDVLFALSKDNESAFHFDCILNQIREEHKLTKKQDVVYKGSGKFFIIDRSDKSPNLFFKVIKEVEFENLQELPVWRKKIVEQLNKDFNFY